MFVHPPARVPERVRLWSLSEDVLVEVGPGGDHLVALTQWGEIRIDDARPSVRESLQRMCLGPVAVDNLPMVDDHQPWQDDPEPLARIRPVLELLGSCVVQSLGLDDQGGPVLSVVPVSRQAGFWMPPEILPLRPIRLSRFVAVRVSGGELVMESPIAQHRVLLHRPLAGWVCSSLDTPTTVSAAAEQLDMAVPVLADIVAYLVGCGMVLLGEPGPPGQPPRFAEDADPDLIPWSHHDLQFHSHSRLGRRRGFSGAVFPHVDRLPAAPVITPPPDGHRVQLYRPTMPDLADNDLSLTEAIETRRTHRDWSERPLTAEQVGELLFRVARIRWTKLAAAAGGATYAISDRPYPSIADLYELELYVSADRCTGLRRGSHHYDPRRHALTLINDSERDLSDILDTAMVAAGGTRRPAVLITMTTRIARLSWMYSEIAYSSTLRHVGALQQTLHLVATAMGLASAALAVSDGAVADEALRLDWPKEVSVGEFLVGARQ
jgi:SagB-type dehydrogenase family enzyme